MSRFKVGDTFLAGVKTIERIQIGDSRGFLSRIFCAEELRRVGWTRPIAQITQSVTSSLGTIRGLHYQQLPHAEMKLVSCTRGEIWDVAVDLRASSPTFLRWYGERLSAANRRALLIPEGFAHGFQALTDECELLYLHSSPHVADAEAGLRYDDPSLNIAWPREPGEVSARDMGHALLTSGFKGMTL